MRNRLGFTIGTVLGGLFFVIGLAGCASVDKRNDLGFGNASETPTDFAMVLTIESSPSAQPRHRRPGQYVLEPDGTLRAAIGPGTHAGLLPPVTARLDPAEVDELWRLTAPLLPPSPAADGDGERVLVAVTSQRGTQRGFLDVDAADPLLAALAELRGDRRGAAADGDAGP